ncbi:uncharacterized protein TNCV_4429001 [Trichonephila clavipes]|nr:uncharacterized protein TNCV_4429001 [Trichonephila clavipes]
MACDAEDCTFQMLNKDEIVTSVQKESDPVNDETDEDEDINNESSKGSPNANAFSALETAMEWYEQQPVLSYSTIAAQENQNENERKYTMCPVSYTAWIAFGFRLSEQSRIRTVSGPN